MRVQLYCLFFQNFCHSYFLGKFGPKIWNSPNKLKFDTVVHCYMLIMILMLSFPKFCHSYNFGQSWAKSNILHIDWNLIPRSHCYMLLKVLMCNFSEYLPFINFWGKFHPKICCPRYLLKFNIEIRWRKQNGTNLPIIFWTKIM